MFGLVDPIWSSIPVLPFPSLDGIYHCMYAAELNWPLVGTPK